MIFCDGHVHIHDGYPIDLFLSAALKNFRFISNEICGGNEEKHFVLWLTESAGINRFAELVNSAASQGLWSESDWRFRLTREPISLIAEQSRGEIVILAGRQIVCAEKIEVLALGTSENIADGTPIVDTIHQVLASDAIPVLPWGFGNGSANVEESSNSSSNAGIISTSEIMADELQAFQSLGYSELRSKKILPFFPEQTLCPFQVNFNGLLPMVGSRRVPLTDIFLEQASKKACD